MCSDGTPGALYVRAGVGDDENRWVVHYQQRWCGQQGALPYNADKMSSDWDGIAGSDLLPHASVPGMTASSPDDEFEDRNHVFVYYCSSDARLGRRSSVTFSEGPTVPRSMLAAT